MFVEETLRLALANKSIFREHWNFLRSINTNKWFKTAEEIVSLELGDKFDEAYYYLRNKSEIQAIFEGVQTFLNGSFSVKEWQQTLTEIERDSETATQFRKMRLELRRLHKPSTSDFNQYYNRNIDWFIQDGLMRDHLGSEDYLRNWKSNKHLYKFTKSYSRAWFATVFLPMIKHDLKVSTNDRSDAAQLAFLVWTDIMVSDDTKFMKSCFELLYGGSGKRLMPLPKFITFVAGLS